MERKNVEGRSKQFYETLICLRDGQIWVQLNFRVTTQIRWDWDDQGTEMEMKLRENRAQRVQGKVYSKNKRNQFFSKSHSPPPVPDLNAIEFFWGEHCATAAVR